MSLKTAEALAGWREANKRAARPALADEKAAAEAKPRRLVCGGQLHKLQPALLSAELKRPPLVKERPLLFLAKL